MVIDFHAHIFPEKIASKVVENIGAFYTLPMHCDGTVEGLLESGRRGGVDRFIVFSAASGPEQVEPINDYIASVCASHPEFTGFGTLHRDLKDPEAAVRGIIGRGLKGVKLHPDMQKFNIDDPEMMKIYEIIEGRLPVVFHTGDYRYPFSHPERLARVIDAFPGLITVAAHFGGWSVFDLALEYFRHRFCYVDVSSAIPFLGPVRSVELIRAYGPERVLFGSDYPMWDPGEELARFLSLDLSREEQEMILYKNAMQLLAACRA